MMDLKLENLTGIFKRKKRKMYPYPEKIDPEVFMMVLKKVKGEEVPLADLLHAAWEVVGFCLHTGFKDEVKIVGAVELEHFEQEIAKLSTDPEVKGGVLTAIFIEVSLQLALKILNNYLKKD